MFPCWAVEAKSDYLIQRKKETTGGPALVAELPLFIK